MLGYILGIFVMLAVSFGVINGRIGLVATAALDGAGSAVQLCISILGIVCLWSGLMNVAKKAGLVEKLSVVLSPLCLFLFPSLKKDDSAKNDILLNMTSNILGLGNAATPFGISAMTKLGKNTHTATNDMIMLTIINTTSIQLIPTTIIALRYAAGSQNAYDILPCVWIASFGSFILAVLLTKTIFLIERKIKCR